MVLSSREVAAVIWLGVAAVWVLSMPKTRRAALGILRQLAGRRIATSLALTVEDNAEWNPFEVRRGAKAGNCGRARFGVLGRPAAPRLRQ